MSAPTKTVTVGTFPHEELEIRGAHQRDVLEKIEDLCPSPRDVMLRAALFLDASFLALTLPVERIGEVNVTSEDVELMRATFLRPEASRQVRSDPEIEKLSDEQKGGIRYLWHAVASVFHERYGTPGGGTA